MKNIIVKIVSGLLFSGIGFASLILLTDYVCRPIKNDNIIHPIHTYFFAFSYGLGIIGTIFGIIILGAILLLFFFLGYWTSGKMLEQVNQYRDKRRSINIPGTA
jgi:uncharacterized membrane protein